METNYSKEQAIRDAVQAQARIEGAINPPSPWWLIAVLSALFPLLGLAEYVGGPAQYVLLVSVFVLSMGAIGYSVARKEKGGVRPNWLKELFSDKVVLTVSALAAVVWLVSLPVIDQNHWGGEVNLILGLGIGVVMFAVLLRANLRARQAQQ